MADVGIDPAMPTVFNLNHPCTFVVRDRPTGSILFVGRVVDPRT